MEEYESKKLATNIDPEDVGDVPPKSRKLSESNRVTAQTTVFSTAANL
jgi:hypothetical protein